MARDNKAGHNKIRTAANWCPFCESADAKMTTFVLLIPTIKPGGAVGQRHRRIHACSASCYGIQRELLRV